MSNTILLQISAFINISEWQRNVDIARVKDQKELNSRLSDLEANQAKLVETLGNAFRLLQIFRSHLTWYKVLARAAQLPLTRGSRRSVKRSYRKPNVNLRNTFNTILPQSLKTTLKSNLG